MSPSPQWLLRRASVVFQTRKNGSAHRDLYQRYAVVLGLALCLTRSCFVAPAVGILVRPGTIFSAGASSHSQHSRGAPFEGVHRGAASAAGGDPALEILVPPRHQEELIQREGGAQVGSGRRARAVSVSPGGESFVEVDQSGGLLISESGRHGSSVVAPADVAAKKTEKASASNPDVAHKDGAGAAKPKSEKAKAGSGAKEEKSESRKKQPVAKEGQRRTGDQSAKEKSPSDKRGNADAAPGEGAQSTPPSPSPRTSSGAATRGSSSSTPDGAETAPSLAAHGDAQQNSGAARKSEKSARHKSTASGAVGQAHGDKNSAPNRISSSRSSSSSGPKSNGGSDRNAKDEKLQHHRTASAGEGGKGSSSSSSPPASSPRGGRDAGPPGGGSSKSNEENESHGPAHDGGRAAGEPPSETAAGGKHEGGLSLMARMRNGLEGVLQAGVGSQADSASGDAETSGVELQESEGRTSRVRAGSEWKQFR